MRLLVILSYFLGLVPIRFPNFCDSLLFSPAEVHDFNSSKPTLTFLDSSSFLFRDGPAFLEDGILDVLLFLWLSYWAVASSCSRSFSFPCSSEISCGYAFFFSFSPFPFVEMQATPSFSFCMFRHLLPFPLPLLPTHHISLTCSAVGV